MRIICIDTIYYYIIDWKQTYPEAHVHIMFFILLSFHLSTYVTLFPCTRAFSAPYFYTRHAMYFIG